MVIEKNGCEIRNVDQWFEFAPPKKGRKHWVDGRSALECARAWCVDELGPQCPSELAALLATHLDTNGATMASAEPECRIYFDKLGGEPRNADVAAIADHPAGRLAINIEAKADETFGDLVRDVLQAAVKKIANDERTNSVIRIQQLASAILPPPTNATSHLGDLRYQLLTGIAGALAFAIKAEANRAVFIVHEFVTNRTDDSRHQANARDLDAFVARLTEARLSSLPPGTLHGPFTVPGADLFPNPPALYIGKAVRDLRR
jgi:Domain of unknown function (DUF6946)